MAFEKHDFKKRKHGHICKDRQTDRGADRQRDSETYRDTEGVRIMRTAADLLMWASAGLCGALRGEDEAGLLREGDFHCCSRSRFTPRASASSVGFKNTRFYSETTQIYSGLLAAELRLCKGREET